MAVNLLMAFVFLDGGFDGSLSWSTVSMLRGTAPKCSYLSWCCSDGLHSSDQWSGVIKPAGKGQQETSVTQW